MNNALLFPDDLIYAVLSSLPNKSIIRFMCVSKTWNSFIHDPYFLQLRRSRSRSINRSNNLFLFVCPNRSDWNIESSNPNIFLGHVPIHEDQGHLELNNSTHILSMPPNLSCIDLDVQSVNGLLCFHPTLNALWRWYSSKQASVTTYICNPTTRQVVTLPNNNTLDLYPEYSLLTHFGYDPLGDKFKVLRVILNNKVFQELRILTVGDNYVWRNVTHVMPCDLMSKINPLTNIGTCVNGAIHWLDYGRKVITVFDVGSEEFGEIPTFDDGLSESDIVIEIGGHLSLVKYCKEMEHIELSILKDYKNHVWVQEKIMLPDGIIPREGYYLPLCRVYTQEIMLLQYHAFNNPFRVHYYETKRGSYRSILLLEVLMPLARELNSGGVHLFGYEENFMRL